MTVREVAFQKSILNILKIYLLELDNNYSLALHKLEIEKEVSGYQLKISDDYNISIDKIGS